MVLLKYRENLMLSNELTDALNDQINLEFYSSNLYLQASAWCLHKGFDGCADFLHQHANEERGHMEKLFNYVHETGGMPLLGAIDAPKTEWSSIRNLFEEIMEHEKKVTRSINALVKQALSEEDFSSFNFLQWYVAEQHEEEHLFQTILDKMDLFLSDEKGYYHIDLEIGRLTQGRE